MATVLVIQDEQVDEPAFAAALEQAGHDVHAVTGGAEALDWAGTYSPDCVVCDVQLRGIDGIEVCKRLKGESNTRLIPVILVCRNSEGILDALRVGADQVMVAPFEPAELVVRVGVLASTRALTQELESAQNVVFALATAMEQKDSYTEGHGERVGMFSRSLAEHIGLTADQVHAVQIGGLLHDVGKIGIPDRILNKPGPLTPDEFEVIKRHPVAGWEICRHLRSLGTATLHCIRNHHERLDGTGYPDALPDSSIPITTRITTICDVFDALATARAYKPAFPTSTCFKILREESERGWWDKELVAAFIDMMNERELFKAANRAKLKPLFARPPADGPMKA